ncbi:MAG: D-glycero-alpha-D-manno-heptose-1,7-bisphosphate 7-phosphatase [Rhodoplanes sp.]
MRANGRGQNRPAVFLDRDGVIVVPEFRDGRSFAPTRLEQFRIYPTAAENLQRLKAAGYMLIVVTNQPDIGKGVIPRPVVDKMHRRLVRELPVDLIKMCAHAQSAGCECRKPKPGMLLAAAAELDVDLTRSVMVGDRKSDVEAGRAAGCRTVFIDLDYTEPRPSNADVTVRSIAEAADAILQQQWKKEPCT